jgi:YYY domain-containing protein
VYAAEGVVVFVLALVVLAALKLWLPLLLTAMLGLSASCLLGRHTSTYKRFIHLLICAGVGLDLAVEFIVLKGDIGRMNTVFKFEFQVWTLWSIAAALALFDILSDRKPWRWWQRDLVMGGAALLFAAGLTYTVGASIGRAHDRFTPLPPGLNGEAYMDSATWQDLRPIPLRSDEQAIDWLRANIQGSPVILEGRGKLYSWASRVSIYTGLPTVLGWDWHEIQQRGFLQQQEIDQRMGDVTTMYSNPSLDAVLPLLRRYNVRYVYVGDFEREYYAAAGLAKFDALKTVYNRDGVQIYEVPAG